LEGELLVAEREAVLMFQRDGDADALAVDVRAVAAAEIDQPVGTVFAALEERVEARDGAAVEEDGAAIAAADGPGLACCKGESASGDVEQERALLGFAHLFQCGIVRGCIRLPRWGVIDRKSRGCVGKFP